MIGFGVFGVFDVFAAVLFERGGDISRFVNGNRFVRRAVKIQTGASPNFPASASYGLAAFKISRSGFGMNNFISAGSSFGGTIPPATGTSAANLFGYKTAVV